LFGQSLLASRRYANKQIKRLLCQQSQNPFNRFFVFQQIIIFCAFVCSVTLQWRSCSHITHPEWTDGLNDKVGSSSVSYLGYRVQTLVWKPAASDGGFACLLLHKERSFFHFLNEFVI